MEIEINAPTNPANGMTIYAEGKRLSKPTHGIFAHFWEEEDLYKILSDKQIKEMEAGKYLFNVATWKIRLLQGKRAAKDNTELKFLMQWD